MLDLAGGITFYRACGTTNLRKSYHGLTTIVKLKFKLDPYSRCMFALKENGGDAGAMKKIRMRFMKNSVIFEKIPRLFLVFKNTINKIVTKMKRNTSMKRLFIIGNGFDRAHNLPTSYWDFRKYILTRYPDAESYYFIPESTLMPKGDEEYDEAEVAGYIVNIIDSCSDGWWSELEAYLGDDVYEAFLEDLPSVNIEDEDCFHDVYTNEDLSEHILNTFVGVNDLFVDWVKNELGDIDFYDIKKPEIEAMIDSNAFFLSFNYTKTLELGYGINENQVCHIHGSVESLPNEIIMGHGNDEPVTEHSYSIGTEASFEKLKRKLRKDTVGIIQKNEKFFKQLSDVQEIYSYGFSFSEVDMVYIKEICNYLNPASVTWYINSYDSDNNPEFRDKIEAYGFKVKVEDGW